jgi:hypothetical protein
MGFLNPRSVKCREILCGISLHFTLDYKGNFYEDVVRL